jgi:dGTPase
MDFLETFDGNDPVIQDVVASSRNKNKKFKEEPLSSRELNDISMQMFRVKSISVMVNASVEAFVENIKDMLRGEIESGFELIKNSPCATFCKATKEFDKRFGFQHKEVLRLELQGNNYIKNMMSMLWAAISRDHEHDSRPFERYAYGSISENYRRVYKDAPKSTDKEALYAKCQLLCDAVSGMTESHLIKKHDELKSLLPKKYPELASLDNVPSDP